MSRTLKLDIAESEEYLEKNVRNAKSAQQKERLQMLWWLKSGQVSKHQQLSQHLGRNPSTITRWLQRYRQGGLSALLEVKQAPGQPPKIQGELLSQLEERLATSEGFNSYGAVQRWLEAQSGQSFNYKTVHKTVRYRLKAKLKVPRPHNSGQDTESVERFKKTLRQPSLFTKPI
jgi:transposase